MASRDFDAPSDSESLAASDEPDASLPSDCSNGLGLLVWLGQVARVGSSVRAAKPGDRELFDSPRSIGRFRLEALLGAGAYGAVFRALDTHLDRHVALKLAWPSVLMDPDASRRFIEEPKIVASAKHRGIVQVYDSGEIEMAAFIALELIDGPTLAEWFKAQEHVSPRPAAQIVLRVAQAMHFAHERGIVHRDLKPSNILLRPCDDGNELGHEPVLTDFGLARRMRLTEQSALTATQAIIGTDHYMSPEQAAGRQDDVGPASDIFSLGVMLYELVAAIRPFDGTQSDEVRRRIQHEPPPSIRAFRHDVPRDFETIILKCLEKSPQLRYLSAADLADDLQRFLNGEPVRARPASVWRRGWQFARRRPRTVMACATGILGGILLAATLGAVAAERRAATERVALAAAAADNAAQLRRQHEFAAALRHAGDSYLLGNYNETTHYLNHADSFAQGSIERGLVWKLLAAAADDADFVLDSRLPRIAGLEFSPDGKLLACGGRGGLCVWETSSWQEIPALEAEPDVSCLAFSSDGGKLAVGSEAGRMRVVRLEDRQVLCNRKVFPKSVKRILWLDDSKLVAGGDDAELALLEQDGREVCRSHRLLPSPAARAWYGDELAINDMLLIGEQRQLVVLTKPSELRLFDPHTLQQQGSWGYHASRNSMCYVPLAGGILMLGGANEISMVSTADGRHLGTIPVKQVIHRVRYSPTTQLLIACFLDGSVQTWDARRLLAGDSAAAQQFRGNPDTVISGEISPQGDWLAAASQSGKLRVWNHPVAGAMPDTPMASEPCWMRFSPCGRWLAMNERQPSLQGMLSMYDVVNGKRLWQVPLPVTVYPASDLGGFHLQWYPAFDPSGEMILLHEPGGGIGLRDSKTGDVVRRLDVPTTPTDQFWLRPGGREVCIQSVDQLRFVDLTDGTLRRRRSGAGNLAYVEASNTDLVWIERTARKDYILKLPEGEISLQPMRQTAHEFVAPAISEDRRRLAAADYRLNVYLWELDGNPALHRVIAPDRITELLFIDNGQTLVGKGASGTITFWHVPIRAELLTLGSPRERIRSFAVHPQQQMLALGIATERGYALRVHRLENDSRSPLPKFEVVPPAPETIEIGPAPANPR